MSEVRRRGIEVGIRPPARRGLRPGGRAEGGKRTEGREQRAEVINSEFGMWKAEKVGYKLSRRLFEVGGREAQGSKLGND